METQEPQEQALIKSIPDVAENAEIAAKSAVDKSATVDKPEDEVQVEFRTTSNGIWHNHVNGTSVWKILYESSKRLLKDTDFAEYDFEHLFKLIADYARFDFEWRVSSPSSWRIEDNKAWRLIGPLDTHHTKNAAVTFNFNVQEVREMELLLQLSGSEIPAVQPAEGAAPDDGNSAFLGVLNDRTTDSFACIGKSGQITIRRTQDNSSTHNFKPFKHGDFFGIRVRTPDIVQFAVNEEWSEAFSFSLGKLTTIYLSVRPIEIAAEVTNLKMRLRSFKIGKLPFCLRNVWPDGFEEPEEEPDTTEEQEDFTMSTTQEMDVEST